MKGLRLIQVDLGLKVDGALKMGDQYQENCIYYVENASYFLKHSGFQNMC